MKKNQTFFLLFLVLFPLITLNSEKVKSSIPVHTYSIVARDPLTGQIGVAVQSHWFSVGSLVPWAEAGVGAVATQSFVQVSYGPEGLALMKSGKSAMEVLKMLIAKDKGEAVRQVAMIDNSGNVSTHTGSKCIAEAGHIIGDQFSVQANMMLKDTVWKAMADAYTNSKGELVERMITALEAAEKEGGDIRGRQSAAILIVSGEKYKNPWEGKVYDLRVEDNPDPVSELKRLVKVAKAYNLMNKGDELMADQKRKEAMEAYAKADELLPGYMELPFWHAVTMVGIGKIDEALPIFEKVFESNKNWMILLQRLVKSELMIDDKKIIEKILSVSKE